MGTTLRDKDARMPDLGPPEVEETRGEAERGWDRLSSRMALVYLVFAISIGLGIQFFSEPSEQLAAFVSFDGFLATAALDVGTIVILVVISAIAIMVSLFSISLPLLGAVYRADSRGLWNFAYKLTRPVLFGIIAVVLSILIQGMITLSEFGNGGANLSPLLEGLAMATIFVILYLLSSVVDVVVIARNQFMELGRVAAGIPLTVGVQADPSQGRKQGAQGASGGSDGLDRSRVQESPPEKAPSKGQGK